MSAIAAAVGFDGLGSWFDRHRRLTTALRWLGWATVGVLAYVVLILIYGKSPLHAFHEIWANTLSSKYGLQDVLVRMTPLLFAALAVTIPARIGQVNVGGEGQIFAGGRRGLGRPHLHVVAGLAAAAGDGARRDGSAAASGPGSPAG